jgi:high frequency lysogenization protein
MREERVIALAGVLQAAGLVRNLAVRGQIDSTAMGISLASVFKIDADNAADVFGGVANLRFGLETLVAQVESGQRDTGLTRLLINIMRLERVLAGRSDVLRTRFARHRSDRHDTADRTSAWRSSPCATLREHAIDPAPRILVEGTRALSPIRQCRPHSRAAARGDPLDSAVATARRQQLAPVLPPPPVRDDGARLLAQCTLSGS